MSFADYPETYPDTLEQAIDRLIARIDSGAELLAAEPVRFVEDAKHLDFRLAALAGAQAYAELLRGWVTRRPVTQLDLDKAELVATAANCAGWLTAVGAVTGRAAARAELIREGFFVFHPAVPGQYVACDRLVAP